jgi:hypothetical protein
VNEFYVITIALAGVMAAVLGGALPDCGRGVGALE